MTAVALAVRLPDLLDTAPVDLVNHAERRDSTPAEARERADRLRSGIVAYAQMRQDIADAWAGRDWIALGYQDWPAYAEAEFGEQLARLARGDRQQAVADLREQGMSTRQIAGVTGIDARTVRRDLDQVGRDAPPATVTGSDGKQHPATRPAKPDLSPAILAALADAGRDGLDLKAITAAWPEPPAEKDLLRALEKLTKSSQIVVTRTWGGGGKPRKWASAAVVGDITPDVERVLADAGPDGRTAWQIAFILAPGQPGPEVAVRVAPVLERLAADGKARGWDAEGGMRWALPKPANTETPGPAEADAASSAVPGTNSLIPAPIAAHYETGEWDCACGLVADSSEELAAHIETPGPVEADAPAPSADPGSEYRSDPAERIAAVAEVAPEFVKPVEPEAGNAARRSAASNLRTVLTYLTSEARTPGQLAQRFAIALDDFTAQDLRFAAETLAALAAMKEQQ